MVANRVVAGLDRVCVDIRQELGLCAATIAVMAPDAAEASVAVSEDVAGTIAELQFALGEGPSREAFETGRPVLVPDLAGGDPRWVGFGSAARASGVGGVYAFPLGVGAVRLGVLTCFSAVGRTLGSAELRRCLVAVDTATELLLSSRGVDGHSSTTDPDVRASLRIRSEVYQAQGMLMAELGISLSDSLARLRAMAYAEDLDLNELAQDLVSGRRPFPDME